MKTLHLLFGTTWRGGAWGLLSGTMVGTVFGALFGNVLVFGAGLLKEQLNFQLGEIPSLIFVAVIIAIIGGVMGALFGVPTGFVVGFANGLLLGIVSCIFFYPLKNVRLYRLVIALMSMIFTAITSWVGFMLIMLLYANQDKADIDGFAIFLIIPAMIAGTYAAFISQIGARWYEKESAK